VVDIGASWGLYGWQLARLVGPRGHVHAVEPNPGAARSLAAVRGRRANFTVHAVALSDQPGQAELHIPVVEGRGFDELGSLAVPRDRTPVEHRRVAVPVRRLDDLLPSAGPPVAFLKCDVEGHERAVLRGAERTLRRSRPAILIEVEQRHQTGGPIVETFEHLRRLGYVGYAVHETGVRPLDEFDVERDQRAWLGTGFMPYAMPAAYVHDFLFVRPGADVGALLAPAPAHEPAALRPAG
jgi:FkbM family methyltransferase